MESKFCVPFNVCRLCLKFDIVSGYSFQMLLRRYTHISTIANTSFLSLSMYDSVCHVCYALVRRFHTFMNTCRQTQNYLQEIVNGNMTEIPNVERPINLEITECLNYIQMYESSVQINNKTEQIKTEDSNDFHVEILAAEERSGTPSIDLQDVYFEDVKPMSLDVLSTDVQKDVPSSDVKSEKRSKTRKSMKRMLNRTMYTTFRYTDDEMRTNFEALKHRREYIRARFKCEICFRTAPTMFHLKKHNEEFHVHRKGDSQCSICKQYMRNKTLLSKHMCSVHRCWYKCNLCDFTSQYRAKAIQAHYEQEHGTEAFTCEHCGKLFRGKLSLKMHMRCHENKEYVCDYCGVKNTRKDVIRIHIINKHMFPLKYRCRLCKLRFATCTERDAHACCTGEQYSAVGDSTAGAQYSCIECNVAFSGQKKLDRHMKSSIHGGQARHRYSCRSCRTGFKTREERVAHRCDVKLSREENSHEDRYCVECNKLFRDRFKLLRHLQSSIHGGTPSVQCRYCPAKYFQHQQRAVHEDRVHSVRSYVCQHCGKTLSDRVLYKYHVSRHEHKAGRPRERRYQCTYCDKKFYKSHHLKSHVNIHTGLFPHKCKECDAAFNNPSTLFQHVKGVHRKIPKKRNYIPKRVREMMKEANRQNSETD